MTVNNSTSTAVSLSVGGNNASTTFSGVISGSGSVSKIGSGILALSGSNTYTGGTSITAGTLQLGDGAVNNGSVQGNVTDSSVLFFANPLAETYAGQISGSGRVTKTAAGVLVLNGSNSYTGGTTLAAGTLQLGDGAVNNGSILGNVSDSSALVFANPLAQTYAGQISGSGSVTKIAVGTLVLDGTSTYSGGTTIAAGILQLGDGMANNGSISGNVADASVLVFANPSGQTYTGQISGSGSMIRTVRARWS